MVIDTWSPVSFSPQSDGQWISCSASAQTVVMCCQRDPCPFSLPQWVIYAQMDASCGVLLCLQSSNGGGAKESQEPNSPTACFLNSNIKRLIILRESSATSEENQTQLMSNPKSVSIVVASAFCTNPSGPLSANQSRHLGNPTKHTILPWKKKRVNHPAACFTVTSWCISIVNLLANLLLALGAIILKLFLFSGRTLLSQM